MKKDRKLLIFTAPSGAGKTTIVRHLLSRFDELAFSVSATTRTQRPHEQHGKDYYFVSPERFKELLAEKAFVESEEVYEGLYYGTLRSELERLWSLGKCIIFDIDVQGARNLKKQFQTEALTVFIRPPSAAVLQERLKNRETETPESLKRRIDKAQEELALESEFDVVLVNDKLEIALQEAENIVETFINQ
ncbi:MAG: guanylate kinase [Saprospiraceae bacterium]|nr:guanylate kinase [Saprospiraceae bacterium]